MIRLVTWNINSVRLRLNLIEKLVQEYQPDVLCLQETKATNDVFPKEYLKKMGFEHQHFEGMKSYNGVAILSRLPLTEKTVFNWQGKEDCRHIAATLEGKIEIHCCYIPAGGDIPDPKENPKFEHKLGFLDDMANFWKKREDTATPKIIVGDFNIAPLEHDVWSHKQLLDVVSHTPIEVKKMKLWQESHNFQDAVRKFFPEQDKLFSWWSYRARDWETSNRGRRLDHIWVTSSLIDDVQDAFIINEARGWHPKPSDHVPVIIDFNN